MTIEKVICQARKICYCGRELELWYDGQRWYEGCKTCNAVYTTGILPTVWRQIYGQV